MTDPAPRSSRPFAAVVLAAGKGSRMRSQRHKVLHPIGGHPMLFHLLDTLDHMNAARTTLVIGAMRDQIEQALSERAGPPVSLAEQREQLGTGHAVQMARASLDGYTGPVVVLYGDVPLIPPSLIQEMLDSHDANGAGVTVLGFTARDPGRYGRICKDDTGMVERIVEFKDANATERAITLCNSGMMVVDGGRLFDWLAVLSNDNAAGEYYLTDLVSAARNSGSPVACVTAEEAAVLGVNSRADLAMAEAAFQTRARRALLDAGVTMTAPDTVFFSWDTRIGADTVIEPHVVFGPGVQIDEGAFVRAFSHIEGAHIHSGASIGPYARIRPGSDIGRDARIGNFVEVKKADIGEGSKVSHLSYIGDAVIGRGANIGAGTITCNYDGYAKHMTRIDDEAFIGSNSALVAPVQVGSKAIVGAGSTITKTVPAGALATTRAAQVNREGAANRFHARGAAAKAKKTK